MLITGDFQLFRYVFGKTVIHVKGSFANVSKIEQSQRADHRVKYVFGNNLSSCLITEAALLIRGYGRY